DRSKQDHLRAQKQRERAEECRECERARGANDEIAPQQEERESCDGRVEGVGADVVRELERPRRRTKKNSSEDEAPIVANAARRALPSRFKRAIKSRLGMPMTRLHSDWKILEAIGPVERPHVVIDAGAHEGWFFHCWKDWCPQAEIHAFEPAIEAFERAKSLYGSDPSIHIINAGLGSARGTLEFNVLESSRVSNSFLQPVESTWKEIDYHTGAISKRV